MELGDMEWMNRVFGPDIKTRSAGPLPEVKPVGGTFKLEPIFKTPVENRPELDEMMSFLDYHINSLQEKFFFDLLKMVLGRDPVPEDGKRVTIGHIEGVDYLLFAFDGVVLGRIYYRIGDGYNDTIEFVPDANFSDRLTT